MSNSIQLRDGLGSVELVHSMGDDLTVVNAARKSFNKEHDWFHDGDYRLMKYLYSNEHMSPFEMVEFMFAVRAPLFVVRQWHRHRTWSYNEVSRRYTSNGMDFYVPSVFRRQSQDNKQGSVGLVTGIDVRELEEDIQEQVNISQDLYHELLEAGVCREQARMVLPQNMMVDFVAKVDLRNLIHFLKLRLDEHAQFEIQQFAAAILLLIMDCVPTAVEIAFTRDEINRALTLVHHPFLLLSGSNTGNGTQRPSSGNGQSDGQVERPDYGRASRPVPPGSVDPPWTITGADGCEPRYDGAGDSGG